MELELGSARQQERSVQNLTETVRSKEAEVSRRRRAWYQEVKVQTHVGSVCRFLSCTGSSRTRTRCWVLSENSRAAASCRSVVFYL